MLDRAVKIDSAYTRRDFASPAGKTAGRSAQLMSTEITVVSRCAHQR